MFRKLKLSLLICAAIVLISYNCASASEALGLDVVSCRPMAEAVIALAEQLGCIITYEDPPLRHISELRPVCPRSKSLIPKSGKIPYDYDPTQTAEEIIQALIQRHLDEGNVGEFKLLKTGQIYNVVPIRCKNEEGQLVEQPSILDTKVTLSLKYTNCLDAIEKLCSVVSKSNSDYKLVPGTIPYKGLRRTVFSEEINNEPARGVLNEILDNFNSYYAEHPFTGADRRWTWVLYFGLEYRENVKSGYAINFRPILQTHPDFMKLRVTHKRPMAAAAKVFEERFGAVITYEDPPYKCHSDILGNDRTGRSLTGAIIEMDWKLGSSIEQVLDLLVNTHIHPRNHLDVYEWTKIDDTYHIYPYMLNNEECELVPRRSIMSRQISFNAEGVNGAAFLELVCSKLSDVTDEKIVLGPIPENLKESLSKQTPASISITNQKARDCLGQFPWKMNTDISWQLLFDPDLKQFKLILHSISE